MTLSVQFLSIISMIIGGMYLGAAVDTFRRFEFHWRKNSVLRYAMEVGFWLLQALVLFFTLFQVNQGELRFYIFLALLCGYAGYKGLLEKSYRKLLELNIRLIKHTIRIVLRILEVLIVKPVIGIFRLLLVILSGIAFILWRILKILTSILFYPLRLSGKLIERLMPEKYKKIFSKIAGICSKIKNISLKVWNRVKRKRR